MIAQLTRQVASWWPTRTPQAPTAPARPLIRPSFAALAQLDETALPQFVRESAAAMIDLQKDEDPWWNYLGGFNMEALEWLRAAARTR